METLNYIPRIRAYYQVLGYGKPYEWARFDDVPFSHLQGDLAGARIGIVTTAAPFKAGAGDQGPGAAYNGNAKFFEPYAASVDEPPRLGISHIAYDRVHTTAADVGTFFPLAALQKLAAEGVIGDVSDRFYGLPTHRSVRVTLGYGEAILEMCRAESVDAVVLVPNCPVCHQSTTLVARVLEAANLPTVIMGCARDIVEHVGAPRLLFSNFPLGNGAGLPDDPACQLETARLAVGMLADATGPRTTVRSPYEWSGDPQWQRHYSNADMLSAEEIAAKRAEFDRVKAEANKLRTE